MGWFGLPHSMAAGFPKRVFQKSQVKIRDILIVSFSLRCRITSIQPHSIGQDCHNVCPDSSGENCWLDKSNIEVTLLKKKKQTCGIGDIIGAVFGNYNLQLNHM